MHTTRSFRKALIILGLLAVSATAYAQQTYQLKLGRGIKEYDQYLLKTSYEQQSRTSIYSDNIRRGDTTDIVSILLTAQCKVISVTVDGQEKEKHIVIRNFQLRTNTDTFDVLPTGTKVRCWFSDSGSVFTVNDVPVHDTVSALLSNVVLGEGGSRTGDVLDAKKPVALGQSWKMNVKAFRKVLGKEQSRLMKKLDGTVTFSKIDSSGAQATGIVTARAEAPSFSIKVPGANAPMTGSLVAEFSYEVPLDSRFPPVSLSTSTTQFYMAIQGLNKLESRVFTKRQSQFIR
jgi:hypothetical protein